VSTKASKKRTKKGSSPWLLNMPQIIDCLQELFLPDEIVEELELIDIDELLLDGFSTIILDLDNTLLGTYERNIPLENIHWIQQLKSLGFRVFVFSNNSDKRRVQKMCIQLKVYGTFFSMKPLPFSLKEFAKIHKINLKKTIYVGDQILTDVFVGNWVKAYSVLVLSDKYPLTFIKTIQKDIEKKLLSFIAPKDAN
jgi:uncharacterized protein